MQTHSSRHMTWVPRAVTLTIDPSNPERFARTLVRCATRRWPRLRINCEHLPCLHTHGVAHFVSHVLLLHQGGAKIQLYNVSPTLFRMLHLLRLDTVFRVYPAVVRPGVGGSRMLAPAA